MNNLKFICPCLFGLESTLNFQIKKLGGEDITVSDGRVSFLGDESMIAKANIFLSVAERVLISLGEFTATTFDELFESVKALPFENFITVTDAFPVKGHSLNSKLRSVPDCQKIIKKAVVTRLSSKYGVSWFTENGATVQIQFNILKDKVSIMLDTTGVGLYKRGYRAESLAAPIKETLASGIVDLARVRSNSFVCDPFCGSGTLLIESAYKALNFAPCQNRRFSAENWAVFSESIWADARSKAKDEINYDATFDAFGSDIDVNAVNLTLSNAEKAGVGDRIDAVMRDVRDFECDENAIIICNPPYGERLLDLTSAEKLYEIMGERFVKSGAKAMYIISPDEEFERHFGKKADKRRKLYNGMIKCQLFMYFR